MKKRNKRARERICHFSYCPLEFIEPMASKAYVLKLGQAPFALWDDVVYDHKIAGIEFYRLAINTTMIIGFQQLSPQVSR